MSRSRQLIISAAVVALGLATVAAECPNACSGHGDCGPNDACICHKGYQAADCSERTCPFGIAWIDTPLGDLNSNGEYDASSTVAAENYPVEVYELPLQCTSTPPSGNIAVAHQYVECSGKGTCDRSNGQCLCEVGYEGSACQRSVVACLSSSDSPDCGGHGQCQAIKHIAETASYDTTAPLADTAAPFKHDYNVWDADKIYGCKCDPGYYGMDCTQRKCPVGVDPLYSGANAPVNPAFKLGFSGSSSDDFKGTFKLHLYDGNAEEYITEAIPCDPNSANAAILLQAINNLPRGAFRLSESDVKFFPSPGQKGYQYFLKLSSNPGPIKSPKIDDSQCLPVSGTLTTFVGNLQGGEFDDRFYHGIYGTPEPEEPVSTKIGTFVHLNPGTKITWMDAAFRGPIDPSTTKHALVKVGAATTVADLDNTDKNALSFMTPLGLVPMGFCSGCVTAVAADSISVSAGFFPNTFEVIDHYLIILQDISGTKTPCVVKATANVAAGTVTVMEGHACDIPNTAADAYLAQPLLSLTKFVGATLAEGVENNGNNDNDWFFELTAAGASTFTVKHAGIYKNTPLPPLNEGDLIGVFVKDDTANSDNSCILKIGRATAPNAVNVKKARDGTGCRDRTAITSNGATIGWTLEYQLDALSNADAQAHCSVLLDSGNPAQLGAFKVDTRNTFPSVHRGVYGTLDTVNYFRPVSDMDTVVSFDEANSELTVTTGGKFTTSQYLYFNGKIYGVAAVNTNVVTLAASPKVASYDNEDASVVYILDTSNTPATAAFDLSSNSETTLFSSSIIEFDVQLTGTVTRVADIDVLHVDAGDRVFLDGVVYQVKHAVAKTLELTSPYIGFMGETTSFKPFLIRNSDKVREYRYVDTCAGRGLCDSSEGVCKCFRGYSNDNCDTQNAMVGGRK